ncbi:MAG: hypothetical protein P4L84_06675 [Isosphaeraceae bacterium]|nr:hypothetical protein [Isosphaeraceae bacterium]
MATASNDAEDIRRKMAQIRRDLHADVREVVVQAEAVADWRRYIRMYPWISVGVAFAVGYAVVPRRRRSVRYEVAPAANVREVVPQTERDERLKENAKKGLLVAAWAAVSPIAIRLAQSYAVHYAENWLLQQQQRAAAAGPPPQQPSQAGWSGGARGR